MLTTSFFVDLQSPLHQEPGAIPLMPLSSFSKRANVCHRSNVLRKIRAKQFTRVQVMVQSLERIQASIFAVNLVKGGQRQR